MQRFQGRQVLLTGEVKSLSDGKVLLRTSDDAEVVVICNPNFSGSFDSAFVELLTIIRCLSGWAPQKRVANKYSCLKPFKLIHLLHPPGRNPLYFVHVQVLGDVYKVTL
eukprot:1154317-Pelagomonas_calceolata.AAC.6